MIWLGFILNAILAYLAFHVTIHPVDEECDKKKIRIFKVVIIACILGSGFVTYYQAKESETQETEFGKRIDSVQTNLQSDFKKRSDGITTRLLELGKQNQDLIDDLAKNPSISPDTRQHIIESNIKFQAIQSQADDLNSWIKKLMEKRASKLQLEEIQKEKQQAEDSKTATDEYKTSYPFYNYAVNSLVNMLGKVAEFSGDKAIPNLQSLPTEIDFNVGKIELGEIKFQTNTNWNFQVYIGERQSDQRRFLKIVSKIGFIDLVPDPDGSRFSSWLNISGEAVEPDSKPITDSKTVIDDALQNFITDQSIRLDPTNNISNH